MNIASDRKNDLIFIALLTLFFTLNFHDLLFQLPNGMHEWAQSDRLALAYGYYENGMNFFKPSTLSQFSKEGVTGVEFPIQAYVTAALAKVFGKVYISFIFRLLDTAIIAVCLFVVYRTASLFTKYFILAALPAIIPLLSPAFMNYTCNYMPDTVATALAMAGMAFYFQTWFRGKNKRAQGLGLCTLATLIKLSSGIYLIGFACYDLFRSITKQNGTMPGKSMLRYFTGVIICFLLVLASVCYNKYLNKRYSSDLFLMDIRPLSKESMSYLIKEAVPKKWLKEYFVLPAYFFILVYSIGFYCIKGAITGIRSSIAVLTMVLLAGIAAVCYLIGEQFIHHDYYILPIFVPLFVTTAIAFSINAEPLFDKRTVRFITTILVAVLLSISFISTRQRLSPDYPGFSDDYNTGWMQGGKEVLAKNGIPHDEFIATFDESPPNLSLIYFDRKGYTLGKDRWKGDLKFADAFFEHNKLRFGVIKRQTFDELSLSGSKFQDHFEPVYKDEKMVLLKRVTTVLNNPYLQEQ